MRTLSIDLENFDKIMSLETKLQDFLLYSEQLERMESLIKQKKERVNALGRYLNDSKNGSTKEWWQTLPVEVRKKCLTFRR